LIVDDQQYNIEALLIILGISCNINSEKYCIQALSGQKAIEAIKLSIAANDGKKQDISLILMDCMMPIKDGFETTQNIRQILHENNLDQPIIVAISGHSEKQYIEHALDSGMNIFLTKPCEW